jgi:hypothetical protein
MAINPFAGNLTVQKKQPTTPQPTPQPAQQFSSAPDPSTWDYKTSPVNLKGESLPAGAQQWTPFGQPYFGKGIGGTVKKYAWALMGSPTQGTEGERWQRFDELTKNPNFWNDPFSPEFTEARKTLAAGAMGKSATKKEDANQIKESNARLKQIRDQYGDNISSAPEDVQKEFKELQSFWNSPGAAINKIESATSGSLLTPVIRGSKVGMQALMDVLSEAAIKFEQTQGTANAMREYTGEQTGNAPGFDIDRTAETPEDFWTNPASALKSEQAQNVGNVVSRIMLPILNTWDAFKFWTAPGTVKQKIEVAQQGYDAGRILYSQAIKPALLSEFQRRAAAGEDPQLLAMELQDPWAEAIGQAIFDPLNFIGMASKAVKSATMLDDATDAVRGGSLGDEAAELLSDAGKTMGGPLGESRAAERMTKFDDLVTKKLDDIEKTRLTPNYNKLTAYSPSGLRIRETKVVQTVSEIATSSIMRNGGTADEVADFFHYLSKAASTDKTIRMEAWDNVITLSQRYGLGRYAFSDDVLETGVLLRNLMEDGDLLKALRAGKGDLAETSKILNRKFQQAVEKQIPTYKEVKKGAEAFRLGDDKAAGLAKKYEEIKPVSRALWNINDGKIGDFKQAVNSFLGKFFFAQPGFVARNTSNNLMTMFVDQGLGGTAKGFYRDGKFWSIADIDADLMKYFGGKLPPATSGLTLTKSENAGSAVTRLNDAVESGFAKRIYWKNFRDTMDKFLTPGVALPSKQEFKAIGMTDEAVNHFTHILKNEAYGNVEQAIVKYSEKFGDNGLLDVWKRWNGSVTADEMKGLSDLGLTKQLDEIVAKATTPQQIKEAIAKLKKELNTRANSAVDNPVGVQRREGFEFMDTLGKAQKDGLLDVDGSNRLNIMIEKGEQAQQELVEALGKARDKYNQMVGAGLAPPVDFTVMEQAFSPVRRGAARQTSQQMTDTAWRFTKQAKDSTGLGVEKLWNESILAKKGPPPAGLNSETFLSELWSATRNEVSNTWEMYFSQGFDRLTPLVDNLTESFPDMQGIFKKSQKASAELNMFRTALYRDGKIYYSQPPTNIRELANRYGISTATGTPQAGSAIPNDKQLLNTINKYGGGKYKTLDEVPLEEAEKALQARASGAGAAQTGVKIEKTDGPLTFSGKGYEEVEKAKALKEGDVINVDGKRWSVKSVKPQKKTQIVPNDLDPAGPTTKEAYEVVTVRVIDNAMGEAKLTFGGLDEYNAFTKKASQAPAQAIDEAADELGSISQPTPNPEVEIAPPYVDGSTPIPGQMWKENSDGILAALNKVEKHMLDNYGMKAIDKLDGSQLKALKGILKDSSGRVTEGIAIADKIGKEWRDFALLPYGETKNFDLALSYAFPYQFWYSRSYTNWMKRVATDPQVIANYARIKESMSRINKDSPEWWRYNLEVPAHFLGLPNEHPMSFNLEANIWPLYGLTGTDFNDPQKRTNWVTSTIDDMGKMGPSIWSPIQWAVALAYRAQGEEEIAQAWAGRVIPQTATIKAISSYFGQPLELDPMVQMFSGEGPMDFRAMDKYERNRVGRALTAMAQEGLLTQEQSLEVARLQEGPVWDEAVRRATQLRAPGQIASYFLGVGMKARTEQDRVTDEFYQEYYRMQNLNESGFLSPEAYQEGWDALRERYPFMDALLLSRKAGPDRDRAYAYNVLGRIPPGQASELYKIAGINSETARKFYDTKGDMKGWSDSEKERFMSSMVDLGATLAIPPTATRQEWRAARADYQDMKALIMEQFGEDIYDKREHYYTLEGAERDAYKEMHPELDEARQLENEFIVNNPLMYSLYGGIQTLESYYSGKVYDRLEEQFGDLQPIFDEYYELQLTDPKAAKRFKRSHPEMDAYNKQKNGLQQDSLASLLKFADKLPDGPELDIREDFYEGNPTQEGIANYAQPQSLPSPEEFQQALGTPLMSIVSQYYADLTNDSSKARLPYQAEKELSYRASKLGYGDGNDLLRDVLLSLQGQ